MHDSARIAAAAGLSLAQRWQIAQAQARRILAKKFDPSQPRDPPGSPTGGQWTGTGGETSAKPPAPLTHKDLYQFEPDWDDMPREEADRLQHAIVSWIGNDHSEINDLLRSGREPDHTVKNIDKVFDHADETTKDYLTYRGIGFTHRGEKPFEVGDEFTDKGFVSTTPSEMVAAGFAESNEGSVIEIVIPKGTKVVTPIVSPEKDRRSFSEGDKIESGFAEPELLINRGSRFKITGERAGLGAEDGFYTIYEARLVA